MVTPAKKVAMCMAEAGFPSIVTDNAASGVLAQYAGAPSAAWWLALRRAGRLAGLEGSPCCDECFVAVRLAQPIELHAFPAPPCEHVEAMA